MFTTTIYPGDAGDDVLELKSILRKLGYHPSEGNVHDIGSIDAVQKFQTGHVNEFGLALHVDPVVGTNTRWALAHPEQSRRAPKNARRVTSIFVHTAAAPHGEDSTAAALRRFHTLPVSQGGRGWRDIGYHGVVRKDGLYEPGRHLDDDCWLEWDELGAQVAGANDRSIGIVCTGNGDLADFTPEQHATLAKQCAKWCLQFGLDPSQVLGHREATKVGAPDPHKTCPGRCVNMDRIRENVAIELHALRGLD